MYLLKNRLERALLKYIKRRGAKELQHIVLSRHRPKLEKDFLFKELYLRFLDALEVPAVIKPDHVSALRTAMANNKERSAIEALTDGFVPLLARAVRKGVICRFEEVCNLCGDFSLWLIEECSSVQQKRLDLRRLLRCCLNMRLELFCVNRRVISLRAIVPAESPAGLPLISPQYWLFDEGVEKDKFQVSSYSNALNEAVDRRALSQGFNVGSIEHQALLPHLLSVPFNLLADEAVNICAAAIEVGSRDVKSLSLDQELKVEYALEAGSFVVDGSREGGVAIELGGIPSVTVKRLGRNPHNKAGIDELIFARGWSFESCSILAQELSDFINLSINSLQ